MQSMNKMIKQQINRSVEEVIIIASSIIIAMTIIPFAIYRFFNNQYLIATLELIGVAVMCAVGVYVWKTRKTKVMSVFTSAFMLIGLISFNYILGTSVLFWIYPVFMTVYFLNSVKVSTLLITPTIIALIPILLREKAIIETISIITTLIICQLLGYILSKRIKLLQDNVVRELGKQDDLTRILNRKALDERIYFLHKYSIRHKRQQARIASLVIFDIDNFQIINDKYGREEGDQILVKLAELLKKSTRDIDQLYRYGDDEFVIIANGSDTIKATELAEKLRSIIENSYLSSRTAVTASFGVAEQEKLESPAVWLDRADKALHRAKRAGKNRVCIANTGPKTHPLDELKSVNT